MYQFLILCLVIVIIFHIFIFHKYNWPKYVAAINKIPGPGDLIYFGSTLRFYKLKHEDMLPDMLNDLKTYGSTFRYWYSGVAVVIVSDIEDLQTVLASKFNYAKGMMYKNIMPWLGTGLLTSAGHKWRTMRKIITPTFHFSILQGYVGIFNSNTTIMLNLIKKQEDKSNCDLTSFVTYCALDNVCETAMGTCINSQITGADSDYVRAIFRFGKLVVERMFNPVLFTDHNFYLSSLGREQSKLLTILHGFTSKIIQDRKQLMSVNVQTEKKPQDDEDEMNEYNKKKSFLEMLLEKQESHTLSDKDIREEVDTFLMAGHDTTAAALTWGFFELGHHPEVQEKCYEELQKIFGDSDRQPNYQDLMEMSYLKRVLQETLRLYPSVPIISRKFNVDVQLKNYLIPANTEMVLVLYSIHRNPDIYPNPEAFDPDRFLPQATEKRHPFAYIPFSAGQRNCVGQKFAMLQMLVIASSILRKYKVESLDDRDSVKVVPEVILRPSKRLRWRITERN